MPEILSNFFSLFMEKSLTVPMWEIVLFVFVASVCMIMGKHRTGIILGYLSVFYWVFVANRTAIMGYIGDSTWQIFVYTISGAVMIAITIMTFFIDSK